MVLKGPRFLMQQEGVHRLSPRMRLANCMSLGMMVTHLAWMAQRLESLKSPTK